MKFHQKIFFAVLIATTSVGTILIWSSYRLMDHWTTKEYLSRYSAFTSVLGDALVNLDSNTESLMRNAAEIVARKDDLEGLLPTATLKEMRSRLDVTHIFIEDKNGRFLRSTNDDVTTIPNAFSFCGEYRQLIVGKMDLAATPLIRPYTEIEPYKFLYMPNKNRTRLIEVGVKVDLVAQTLTKAIGADPNLISVSLFSPVGEVLGRFSSSGVQYSDKRNDMPTELPLMIDHGDTFRYFVKIPSSHPRCCQCDVARISRNGEYYYVLESEISKNGLKVAQTTMHQAIVVLCIIALILSLLISRFVSRRLVKNIEEADRKLKRMMAGSADRRLDMTGGDEVAFLATQFDSLLDQFEQSQAKLIESEKLKTKVQMAREVAHNIKSPTIAIEMIMPLLKGIPDNLSRVLADSASDIRSLAERLLNQAALDDKQNLLTYSALETIPVGSFLKNLIEKKTLEHNAKASTYLVLRFSKGMDQMSVLADRTELSAVISNLINNARESYSGKPETVHVTCTQENGMCKITVKDSGIGIPQQIVNKLGQEEITIGKPHGRGIGLVHAFKHMHAWGGHISIESSSESGTSVELTLPCVKPIKQSHGAF